VRAFRKGEDPELRKALQVRERRACLRPVSAASSRSDAGLYQLSLIRTQRDSRHCEPSEAISRRMQYAAEIASSLCSSQ